MLASTHAIVGASIAKIIPNPFIAFIFAVISHPILDCLPHWDMNTRTLNNSKAIIVISSLFDAFIGFLIGFIFFGNSVDKIVLFTAMFLAQLIDWIEAPYHIFGWTFPPFSTVKYFQHYFHVKTSFPNGIYTQLILSLLCILLLS